QMLAVARSWAKVVPLDAVAWADGGRLEPRNFRSLCRFAAQRLREQLMSLSYLDQAAGTLERIEEVNDEPLYSSEQLLAELSKQIMANAGQGGGFYISDISADWLLKRMTPDHQLALLRLLAAPGGGASSLVIWRAMLRVPMSEHTGSEGAKVVLA